jgi:hypothetical protein
MTTPENTAAAAPVADPPQTAELDNMMMALHLATVRKYEPMVYECVRRQKELLPENESIFDYAVILMNVDEQICVETLPDIRAAHIAQKQQYAVFPVNRNTFSSILLAKWVPDEINGNPYKGPPPYLQLAQALMVNPKQGDMHVAVFHGGMATGMFTQIPVDVLS